MAIIVVNEVENGIVGLGGEAEGVFGKNGMGLDGGGGCMGDGTEGCVGVVDNVSLNIHEVGDVFVAVVEVVGDFA